MKRSKMLKILIGIIAINCLVWLDFEIVHANDPYPESKYADLLREFEGWTFRQGKDYEINVSAKTIYLIHDVDFDVHGVTVFAQIEGEYGLHSSLYLRPDADYFTQNIGYFQRLEHEGWEIGFHYDCLSRCNGNRTLATALFIAQLSYMRSFFTITSCRPHGDNYDFQIYNGALFNQTLWKQLGLTEVANVPGSWHYITDTNRHFSDTNPKANITFINLHSDYW
jgi:hypothetical protein